MSEARARPCPACGGPRGRFFHRQEFVGIEGGSLVEGYDLVTCARCGMAYADGIPSQREFDEYYERLSKYEFGHLDGGVSESDRLRFRAIVDRLAPHLAPGQSIVDIGCATGGLLGELLSRGFSKLFGLDPSPRCAEATTRNYGVMAKSGTFADLSTLEAKYDVALLIGVLEHIEDCPSALVSIERILVDSGLLLVEVPDVARFREASGAPFQLFSVEHINYFAPATLRRLLAAHGFEVVDVERIDRPLSPFAVEPTLSVLFRKSSSKRREPLTVDLETASSVEAYVDASRLTDETIREKIATIVEAREPLVVWGVGTHTQRLLSTSRLHEANVLAYVDSNARYWGKTLDSREIVAPSEIASRFPRGIRILISSQVAEAEIKKTIENVLALPNPVITLYG